MKNACALIGGAAFAIYSAGLQAVNPDLCSPDRPSECLNGVSASATSLATVRVSMTRLPGGRKEGDTKKAQATLRPIVVAATERISGLLGEDPGGGWATWASYGESRYGGRSAALPSEAKLHSLKLGVDRLIGGRYSLGAALVLDRLDVKTRFNGGGEDGEATTLAPYLAILVSDAVSVDLNAGYGVVRESQNRIDPTSLAGTPGILRSSFDGRRRFWSVSVNGMRDIGNWTIGGRAGYLDSREDQDGYAETGGPSALAVGARTIKLQQLLFGADAAYRLPRNLEIYSSGLLRRDSGRDGGGGGGLPAAVLGTGPVDRTQWDWTLGLRYFGPRGLTLAAEWIKTSGRDFFHHRAVNLLARMEF